jgi:nucleoside-diphosphate-sugar epimerase
LKHYDDSMRVLITGSSGFIGRSLIHHCATRTGLDVIAASRTPGEPMPGIIWHRTGDMNAQTPWESRLAGVNAVIHLAGRAHVIHERATDPERAFMTTNHEGTKRLAEEAARAGVRRFILVSTIGVLGKRTPAGRAFQASDPPAPHDAYSRSKLAGEHAVREIGARTGMEVTVVRPPMVIGPGAPGNFARLVRLVRSGVPIPLGRTPNTRSMLARDNLVDLLLTCLTHPKAAGATLLASDGEDLSTHELVMEIAAGLGARARVIRLPDQLLELGLQAAGLGALHARLCGSLQINLSATTELLGWRPPNSGREAIRRAAHEARD